MTKKKDAETVEVVEEASATAEMGDALLKKLVGSDAQIGAATAGVLYGVPLPYFALRYLLTSSGTTTTTSSGSFRDPCNRSLPV